MEGHRRARIAASRIAGIRGKTRNPIERIARSISRKGISQMATTAQMAMTTVLIGEGRGKRSGRRVVATQPQFNVEVSFEDLTNLAGVDGVNIGTYQSTGKPDGSLDGHGQGV